MSFFSKKESLPFISAVIVAAGPAKMTDGPDGQYALLDGSPVVARSIDCLNGCSRISEIIVVCREECIADYYGLVRDYDFGKAVSVVAGGKLRQDSVFAGIGACSESAEFFAIHDGARPLILPEEVDACIDKAVETGAAAVGVPVRDTVKMCDESGMILSTPRRDRLWAVQTPQIFETGLYRRAMEAAIRQNRVYTDDCQLVENIGHPVAIIHGSHENIKITEPEDIALANAILAFRREGSQLWRQYE